MTAITISTAVLSAVSKWASPKFRGAMLLSNALGARFVLMPMSRAL